MNNAKDFFQWTEVWFFLKKKKKKAQWETECCINMYNSFDYDFIDPAHVFCQGKLILHGQRVDLRLL